MHQTLTAANFNLVWALQARVAISDARTADLQADLRCIVVEVADVAGRTESNPHLSSSGRLTVPAVDSATGSAPDSAFDTMLVSAADSVATLFSGPVPDSGADSAGDCSSADCVSSGVTSSVIQISVDARGCTGAGTADLQPSRQPSITAEIQPEDGSTAESASKREPGAASDSAGVADSANNPAAACSFSLEKQASADVVEALLEPSQHAESGTSAQTEALFEPSQHAESGTSAQTEALPQPGQHAESRTSAQTEALLQPGQHAESGTSAQTEARPARCALASHCLHSQLHTHCLPTGTGNP